MYQSVFEIFTVFGSKNGMWPGNLFLIKKPEFFPNYYDTGHFDRVS